MFFWGVGTSTVGKTALGWSSSLSATSMAVRRGYCSNEAWLLVFPRITLVRFYSWRDNLGFIVTMPPLLASGASHAKLSGTIDATAVDVGTRRGVIVRD